MDLNELLETVRQSYVDRLALAIHQGKSVPGARVSTEEVRRDAQGNPLPEGRLGLPVRVDVVVQRENAAGDVHSVASDEKSQPFTPLAFDWPGGLHVEIHPFRWDALRLHFPEGSVGMEWEPLLGWYEEWFKADEDGTGDLLLVVHAISGPVAESGGATLIVDLGSAPVVVLEELFDALAGLDVSRVILGEPGDEEALEA